MKKIIFLTMVFLGVRGFAQPQIKIKKDAASLQVVSGDTSYVYNAYVVTSYTGAISSIHFVFKNYSGNNIFPTEKDSSYTWSSIVSEDNNVNRYAARKVNSQLVRICLGRLYYSTRQRFTIGLTGNNLSISREYNF